MFPEAIVRNHPHIDCCHQHLNLRVTLDGPLEEGLASLARGDPVVEPGGHVAAHETTPLRLFLFILDHLAKTITMHDGLDVDKDDLDLWEAVLCGGRA